MSIPGNYNTSFVGEKPIVYFYCPSNSLKCTGVNGKALQVHVHAHVCALDMKRLILYYKSQIRSTRMINHYHHTPSYTGENITAVGIVICDVHL